MDAKTWAEVVEIARKLAHIDVDLEALYKLTDNDAILRARGYISQSRRTLLEIKRDAQHQL